MSEKKKGVSVHSFAPGLQMLRTGPHFPSFIDKSVTGYEPTHYLVFTIVYKYMYTVQQWAMRCEHCAADVAG